ncbi:transmembrane protein 30C [Chanodichthys erythropterus]|uniref:transmembrane protein 30C n=1 Tax=Chanodichthys erythropterus TaxID=933992 RepID=UPI00351EB7FE
MGKKQAGTGPLSRRPDNSAFKQQRLPAWSPSLTAQTVLPTFYILSLVCLFLGIWLLITVENTYELKVDYTNAGTCERCFEMRKHAIHTRTTCECLVNFYVPKTFSGDVFFYYGLRNFHQNLRRYMDSRDDTQMVGRKNNLKAPSSYCAPFDYDANGVPIAPCGAVANSRFNDSFTVRYYPTNGPELQVPLYRKGIAWYTDKNVKFRNPPTNNTFTLQQAFEGTIRPLYWQRPVYELDDTDHNNNGFINDDLIVWMREAAFPNFKKLYGVLNRAQGPFTQGLPAGNYSVSIFYNFPVEPFRGQKELVISMVTWFGGQNYFLPIAYLVTSGLILVAAIILTVVYVKVGKKGKNMEE